jgi:hypothetical protein
MCCNFAAQDDKYMQHGQLLLAVQQSPVPLERLLAVAKMAVSFLTDLLRPSTDTQVGLCVDVGMGMCSLHQQQVQQQAWQLPHAVRSCMACSMHLCSGLAVLHVCIARRTFPSWCWALAMKCTAAPVLLLSALLFRSSITQIGSATCSYCLQDIPILVLGHHYVSHRQLGEAQRFAEAGDIAAAVMRHECSPRNAAQVLHLLL